ncbi:MAG: hypothetical protein HOD52_03360 [Candidatus Marinimicrobia bacterium]|nr:hypothetical protein [Candidatus Neomarinimicrobiota bacterium]
MKKIIFFSFFLISCSSKDFKLPSIKSESRYPRLSPTKNNGMLMSWFEKIDSLNWAINWSEFSDGEWSKNQTISKDKDYFVNWADFPSIYHFGGDTIAAHWLQKSGQGSYDYDIKVITSYDRGNNWSKPKTPHLDGVKGEHGFVSFFKNLNDQLGLVWLDGRNMGGSHSEDEYGSMNLYQTTFTSNGELNLEMRIDDMVCECCPTSAIRTENALLIAYRNRSVKEIRDINIIRYSKGTWYEPYAVNKDNWEIAGCPVNGPMLANYENELAIAWYTSPNQTPTVSVSFSMNEGESFEAPFKVDLSQPIGRVDLIWINNNEVIVSWIEYSDSTTNILARIVSKNGKMYQPQIISKVEPGRVSGYPQMEIVDDQLFFAWTEGGVEGGIKSKWVSVSEFR